MFSEGRPVELICQQKFKKNNVIRRRYRACHGIHVSAPAVVETPVDDSSHVVRPRVNVPVKAEALEHDSGRVRPRLDALAETGESESGAHRASGVEPRNRSTTNRWQRLQTIPSKVQGVLRHMQLGQLFTTPHPAEHICLLRRFRSAFKNIHL